MIFQILIMDQVRNVFYYLQNAGIVDILIPFVLIFTVLFAILKNVTILKDPKHHITVALAITFLVIIPHVTQSIPPQYDVVQIINNSLPSIVLIIFIVLMAMILLGFVTGRQLKMKGFGQTLAAIISVILIAIIFGRSAGYFQRGMPSWLYWLDDPQLGALVVVILMFALITWFITGKGGGGGLKKIKDKIELAAEELFGGSWTE